MEKYYIYMVSNPSRMLYVGLTTDIPRMVVKHREQRMEHFRGNFSFNKLVYVEETNDVGYAIERAQTLRKGSNYLKADLLKLTNPKWECMSSFWLDKAIRGFKEGI